MQEMRTRINQLKPRVKTKKVEMYTHIAVLCFYPFPGGFAEDGTEEAKPEEKAFETLNVSATLRSIEIALYKVNSPLLFIQNDLSHITH